MSDFIERILEKAKTPEQMKKIVEMPFCGEATYYDYVNTKKWVRVDDVIQLLEKIDKILNHEYPSNWSPCAVAMTRLSRLRELLKK